MSNQNPYIAKLLPYLFPEEVTVLEKILDVTNQGNKNVRLADLAGAGVNFKKIENILKSLQKFNIITIDPNITTPDRFFIILNMDETSYNDTELHKRRNRRWGQFARSHK